MQPCCMVQVPTCRSLSTTPNSEGAGDPPAWFAKADAIKLENGKIFVTVGNRGQKIAKNVEVHVWWCKWPSGKKPPLWLRKNWTEMEGDNLRVQDIPAGELREYSPFNLTMEQDGALPCLRTGELRCRPREH